MNFSFGEYHQYDWEDFYGVQDKNGQPKLFLGPKGWLFSLEHGTSWFSFGPYDLRFVVANGTASYTLFYEREQKPAELVFKGTDIQKIYLRRLIPPVAYELLCRRYKRSQSFDQSDRCIQVFDNYWGLQILKELIAKGQVHLDVEAELTPCKSLLEQLELQPISSLCDREALLESILSSYSYENRGLQDLYLAQEVKANIWWVPLFAPSENTPNLLFECWPKEYRVVQALPFAVITEHKEKERFSLFIVDTVNRKVTRLCQRKNITDLLPFLRQKILEDLLRIEEPQMGEVNFGTLCIMRAWSMQARHSNGEEMISDIEKLQHSLLQWAFHDDYFAGPDLQRVIRECCVSNPATVQQEQNGL